MNTAIYTSEHYFPVLNTESLNTSLLENLTTAVIVMEKDLRVIYLNPAAEALLETSLNHCYHKSISKVILHTNSLVNNLQQVQEHGITYIARKENFSKMNHNNLMVDYAASRLNEFGESYLVLELQELDRSYNISRKEMLISNHETTLGLVRGLGHEIKNPLGGIRGAAQLLEAELDDNDLKDYTQVIIDETDRLCALIDRLTGAYKQPALQSMNIHEILERVYSLVRAETKGQIKITKDYDPSIPDIIGDLTQLIQAVLNIVRNAMQSLMEANPPIKNPEIILRTRTLNHVTIGPEMHKLVARIEIIDNGPGVEDELIENIFYPLISGRAQGTGLGLSLSQSILKNHDGLIECDSHPGQTRFILSIPLTKQEPSDDV